MQEKQTHPVQPLPWQSSDPHNFFPLRITDIRRTVHIFQSITSSAPGSRSSSSFNSCNVSLCIGKRLFTDIIIRHQILKSIGDFQWITKYAIIFDLHCFDACIAPLFGLSSEAISYHLSWNGGIYLHLHYSPFNNASILFWCKSKWSSTMARLIRSVTSSSESISS